mgnify:CR=1 FL=1
MKIKFIFLLFAFIWLGIITRVFLLSIKSNEYYTKLSQQNTIKSESIAPVRGEILDRNLIPIAINKLGFKIQLAPHLHSKKNLKKFNDEINTLLLLLPNLDKKKIIKNYMKKDSYYNHNFIDIVPFIAYQDIIKVYATLNLRKNIKILAAPKRFYPFHNIAAHMIGYVSRANKKEIDKDSSLELIGYMGKTGIEKQYNDFLQGQEGKRKIKVNASNQEIEELSYESPTEDKKLILNIDIKFQKYISELFQDKVGSVIVMDTQGAILTAASFPNYDLNIFVSGMSYKMYDDLASSLDHPFTNKFIHGLYPPGSSIKPLLGLLYITTDLNERWRVDCRSSLPLGGRIFRCWRKKGHRHTGITKAIRESCDDFFYKGSLILGNKKISTGLKRYGLGAKTGIDLPNEFIGVVPSSEWKMQRYGKRWSVGETANMAIGQGDFLTTPLQIAQQTVLLATGKLPIPHLLKLKGSQKYAPVPKDVFTDKELKKLPIIQNAMYEVCNSPHGTATNYLNHSKVILAGKTGTAQVVGIKQDIKKRKKEHELSYYSRSHAWLTTYGPYKNPQYIVTVMVEHGGHGGQAAGTIVSDIYNKLLELGYIKN